MTNKTRKHIWPGGLLTALAVVGLLAVIVVLASNPGAAMAHGGGDDHAAACEAMTEDQQARHDAAADQFGGEKCQEDAPPPPLSMPLNVAVDGGKYQITVSWSVVEGASRYRVQHRAQGDTTWNVADVPGGDVTSTTISRLDPDTTYEVQVIAIHPDDPTLNSMAADASGTTDPVFYDLTLMPNNGEGMEDSLDIEAAGQVTVTATVETDSPADTTTVSIRIQNSDGTVGFDETITYVTAGINAPGARSIEDGTLDIQIRDAGERAFDIIVECMGDTPQSLGGTLDVEIRDDNQTEVASATISCVPAEEPPPPPPTVRDSGNYSVVSYDDWDHPVGSDVTDGFVIQDPTGVQQRANSMTTLTGWMQRDEPVVREYQLGLDDVEYLTRRDQPELGQNTIEVLAGAPHVQLTVTATEEGPAYIRFLDSDMMPFGTDVDEHPDYVGADVVGLDSQGKLLLNVPVDLSAALALAFDHYQVVTPFAIAPVIDNVLMREAHDSELRGLAGSYHQGTFRFFNPCPTVGHTFYVEVYEKSGKYLRTTEQILCVPSPRPGPTGLSFEVDSQKPGEGTLNYRHALNAASHTVLLVDGSNGNIVQEIPNASEMVTFDDLNNGWTYHLIVLAKGLNNQFTADAVTARVQWLGQEDVPLSTDPPDVPTESHDLCQTGNANVMALLADCGLGRLTAPVNVMATASDSGVTVTWNNGANADRHMVVLFAPDWTFNPNHVAGNQTDGNTTFNNVPSGVYTAVVIAIMNNDMGGVQSFEIATAGVTVN